MVIATRWRVAATWISLNQASFSIRPSGVFRLFILVALLYPAVSSAVIVRTISGTSDGDTVKLTTGQYVRLLQIDSPEVNLSQECYGAAAERITRSVLPRGTVVKLSTEHAAGLVDRYGRLLRYAIRAKDSLNVNLYLVRIGAAAPYFYNHIRGRYADTLERLALAARKAKRGLWGACPGTPYNPYRGVDTGPPR